MTIKERYKQMDGWCPVGVDEPEWQADLCALLLEVHDWTAKTVMADVLSGSLMPVDPVAFAAWHPTRTAALREGLAKMAEEELEYDEQEAETSGREGRSPTDAT